MQPKIELPDIGPDPLGTAGAITETESERIQIEIERFLGNNDDGCET